MKCVRFKMTPAGRRCAKFSGRKRSRRSYEFGEFSLADFGAPKKGKRRKPCDVTVGLTVRPHTRSCPRAITLPTKPRHSPYKISREKALRLGAEGKPAKKAARKSGKRTKK